MYIESVPNRNSPPAILLRESYRDAGKVKKRTLANLSHWPPALIEGLRTLLKGGHAVAHPDQTFTIIRSQPHGHVAAVLGTLKDLRLPRLIARRDCPERQRVLALIVARLLHPGSKLATARGLAAATARDSLAETLALGDVNEDDLYAAMDWLLNRQERIERGLAQRHLKDGALVLYDLTSVYLEGQACPLARRGYPAYLTDLTMGCETSAIPLIIGVRGVAATTDRQTTGESGCQSGKRGVPQGLTGGLGGRRRYRAEGGRQRQGRRCGGAAEREAVYAGGARAGTRRSWASTAANVAWSG